MRPRGPTNRRCILSAFLLAPFVLSAPLPALGQQESYPSRTIRMLVPFSPGALTDIVARIYAEKMSSRLGQPVVVENRPGSGGVIASQALLNAPADGYTIMMVSSAHAVNPALYAKLPYDTLRDFSGVALVASSPSVVVVRPGLGVKTLKELVALAKSKPGTLNYGSAGLGSATHLVGEYFRSQTGIDIVHVPYKGVQEAVNEVIAGRIDIAFPPIALALAQMQAGKVVGVAMTAKERSSTIPTIPSVAESGYPGFEYAIWYALVASSKTPPAALDLLAKELREITAMPDVRQKLTAQGLIPQAITRKDFDALIAAEINKLGGVVKASGAKAE